jgi:ubiquinone/menaquinone biosynthesis C-methylase UbiE
MIQSLEETIRYYLDLGALFEEMSDYSRCMNLGYLEAGHRVQAVCEAQKRLIRRVAAAGDFRKGMRVLDVGCGLGGPAALVASEFRCRVTGVDPGSYQLKRLQERPKDRKDDTYFAAVSSDAQDLPFRSGAFDRVYSVESAFHYPNKPRFIRESERVLKSDGFLVVADILRKSFSGGSSIYDPLRSALAAPQFFDLDAYRSAASSAGLKLIAVQDISRGVNRAMRLWSRVFLKKRSNLAKRYPSKTLFKIGTALLFTPFLAPFTPFQYAIMVFRSERG